MSSRMLALVAAVLLFTSLPFGIKAAPPSSPIAVAPNALPGVLPAPISLNRIGRYDTTLGAGSAEIVAFDPVSKRMALVNAASQTVDIVDISNPATPTKLLSIDTTPYGGAPNSVDVRSGVIAVAVEATPKTNPGKVVFFNTNGVLLNQVTVGSLPDMLTFTPNSKQVLVANEGEPSSYNQVDSVDPEGSISIITLPSAGIGAITTTMVLTATTVAFTDFNVGGSRNAELSSEIRIFGPNASVAQDLEPEYITVSPDSSTAYVTLQENNAVAIVSIATGAITAIVPLGYKDHSVLGNGLDSTDREGGSAGTGTISISQDPVLGMYQPDAIASFVKDGQIYLVTANEGDARDYTGFAEEARVSTLDLDNTVFPNEATLKTTGQLGRLTVTTTRGDLEIDGDYDQIYAFGARSFSIWNGTTGALVFDSGDEIEQRTASLAPTFFNSDGATDSFDTRSDNKGPEPEAAEVASIGGRIYAFIGLERIGGVMVYDITTPTSPTFVQYATGRGTGGDDIAPEGMSYIAPEESPNGKPLLLVANEVSGTVAIYEISVLNSTPDGAGSLSLLHNNDGESALSPTNNTVARVGQSSVSLPVGGIAAFKTVTMREISDARSRGNALINVYAGDAFLASSTLACSLPIDATTPIYDAIAQTQIPYTAHIFGNHEFDYTPVFLKRFVDAFGGSEPFLSANLNFSAQSGYTSLIDDDGLIEGGPSGGQVIGRSMVYTDTATGQRFGIVGATTPLLTTISSPDDVTVTADIPATAAAVQAEVDRLIGKGIKKIILVSHMQSLSQDRELIALLKSVDIVVAGGGDDLLSNPAIDNGTELLPGDSLPTGTPTYPLIEQDADNRDVYVVTTAGNYRYVGRLDVEFDANGEVSQVISERSYPRRVIPASSAATTLGLSDTVTPDPQIESSTLAPINSCLTTFAATVVARSEVVLDLSRNGSRTRETNAGNLIADSFLRAYDNYATANSLPARSSENPVIAIQNGGGIRQTAGNAIPATAPGDITRKNTLDILPFANFVTVVNEVTPTELKSILERSVANLPAEGGQFLQVAGITITVDLNNPAQIVTTAGVITVPGSRVIRATLADGRDLILAGQPVDGAPNVRIVTNSFTADGGDNYPTLAAKTSRVNLRSPAGAISYEQAWLEYLQSFPQVNGIPTIPASDSRYAVGGEDRIIILSSRMLLPLVAK
ncbi:MAG: hypothetical protein OHK0050_16690 [Roseiflexaceae bacterium]